ncbi:uncharacterized protein [Notothenia coriiceps]|uniref:Fibronectin type-III domain-containing protein n=1 Tax=Notothenia coriiceps TaxID=8208 RepID=A0A6I9NRS6_9TELE|nr:PREDICTED: uncharacterized protein LOC104952110 [Notothenia coriiceps]
MVMLWTAGDVFKTVYFVMNESPAQFWVCSSVQILIDVAILLQQKIKQAFVSLSLSVLADSLSPPVNVTISAVKANSAVVTWDIPEGDPVIGFAITQQKKDVRMLRFIQEVNTTTRSCALWDLEEETDYIVHVQSISMSGSSPLSEPLRFRTPKEAETQASKSKAARTQRWGELSDSVEDRDGGSCLTLCWLLQGEDTDRLCGAIAAIAEVFKLTDPTLLFLEVTTLVSKYPDIREEHIQALLAVRGDASREMRQMIIGTLSENKVTYSAVTQPIFKDIAVPTITNTMTSMTSMATAKLLK